MRYLFFCAISFTASEIVTSQDLTCKDFKTGTFYIPETEDFTKYIIRFGDSTSLYQRELDSTVKKYIVIRDTYKQVEWKNGVGEGVPEYENIEWIDDCTYRLTYDAEKADSDFSKLLINKNNGIVVSKVNIEGNCMRFEAVMTTLEGQVISQNGIICK